MTEKEWWVFFGILLGAHCYGDGGSSFWSKSDVGDGVLSAPNMDQYMKEWRFKEIKKYKLMIYADAGRKKDDPWWQFVSGVEQFNMNRQYCVASSKWKVFDESMSAFRPQTSPTGNLPHISYVERKPEPLGTEFKTCCCFKTGIMLSLEIVRGRSD